MGKGSHYDPYGRITKVSGDLDSDFLYTSHYYHEKSQLSLAKYRAYDGDLGRWISRDPISYGDGPNVYGYVSNNPLKYVDIEGLYGIWVFVGITVIGCGIYSVWKFIDSANEADAAIKEANEAYKRYIDNPTLENFKAWQDARNKAMKKIRNAANDGAGVPGSGMQGPMSVPTSRTAVATRAGATIIKKIGDVECCEEDESE